jgi:hypothetical protein
VAQLLWVPSLAAQSLSLEQQTGPTHVPRSTPCVREPTHERPVEQMPVPLHSNSLAPLSESGLHLHGSPNFPGEVVLVLVLEGTGEGFLHAASKSAAESRAASSVHDFADKHVSCDSVWGVLQSCLHCSPLTLAGAPHSVAFAPQRCTQLSV